MGEGNDPDWWNSKRYEVRIRRAIAFAHSASSPMEGGPDAPSQSLPDRSRDRTSREHSSWLPNQRGLGTIPQ